MFRTRSWLSTACKSVLRARVVGELEESRARPFLPRAKEEADEDEHAEGAEGEDGGDKEEEKERAEEPEACGEVSVCACAGMWGRLRGNLGRRILSRWHDVPSGLNAESPAVRELLESLEGSLLTDEADYGGCAENGNAERKEGECCEDEDREPAVGYRGQHSGTRICGATVDAHEGQNGECAQRNIGRDECLREYAVSRCQGPNAG